MNERGLISRRNKQTRGQGQTSEFPRLLGGRLCLHLVNTIEGPLSHHPVDFLAGYADLARWTWHTGALERADADRLIGQARSRPADAAAVFARTLGLREAIERVFRRIARSGRPDEEDLARLQREFTEALANARLTTSDGRYAWVWDRARYDMRKPLWLVTQSAVELLTEGELSRIRECPGAGDCGWLFYDTSRNGTRRWCSMEGCGSRVKMRRRYARRRQVDMALRA